MTSYGRYLLIIPLVVTIAVIWFVRATLSTAPRLADETLKGSGLTMALAIERLLELERRPTVLATYAPRDLAYASVTDETGIIRFHSNPSLTGKVDPEFHGIPLRQEWSRVRLGTGEEIQRLSLPIHPGGERLLLTIGLHTYRADEVIRQTREWVTILALSTLLIWGITAVVMVLLQRLIRQREELERQKEHALIGRMAAVMAHEIRNPLAGIKGFAQLMAYEEKIEKIRHHADRIVRQSTRLEQLVTDLLSFSRIDDPTVEPVDLPPLVDEAVALIAEEAKRCGVSLVPSIHPVPPVVAHPDRIMQLLLNLLKNALQAMPEGGTLTIGLREEKGGVTLTVTDTG